MPCFINRGLHESIWLMFVSILMHFFLSMKISSMCVQLPHRVMPFGIMCMCIVCRQRSLKIGHSFHVSKSENNNLRASVCRCCFQVIVESIFLDNRVAELAVCICMFLWLFEICNTLFALKSSNLYLVQSYEV